MLGHEAEAAEAAGGVIAGGMAAVWRRSRSLDERLAEHLPSDR
jgi:hypothetical protein